MPSVFTRILSGSLPGTFVHRDPLWAALLDIAPVAPGHLLLVPGHEAALLHELPVATLAALGPLIATGTACLRRALNCDAVSVLVRDGAAAGQEVPHVHVHLVPRRSGEGGHSFTPGRYGEGQMAAMGSRLQAAWSGRE